MIEVKNRSFSLDHCTFGRAPSFQSETPWDDRFAFKPQITVPMAPSQKGVRMAQLQGDEDALVLPVAVTQIPPDSQFPQEECIMILMPYYLKLQRR